MKYYREKRFDMSSGIFLFSQFLGIHHKRCIEKGDTVWSYLVNSDDII